jgi:hypothetical protein
MRSIAALALTATALLVGTTTSSPADASVPQGTTFLDNGIVRVGVDLSNGAKITFVGAATGPSTNLVQDVQPSYYSGPYAEGGFPGWHAFSSGATTVLASRNDGRTIYTKTLAADERTGTCECLFEQWVTIKGRAIHVRNRLTAWRADATRYAASPQELPALYTTGRTYRVFTYDGRRPYTGAPLHEVTEDAGGFFSPGPSWLATEHWAAVVDNGGFGIGLFKPDLVRFAGTPGTPGGGWVNGYLAASTTEVIDANQVYDYDDALVVGSLRQIRAYAYANRPDARPDYRFRTDRQHWWYSGATDRGSPVRGALRFLVGTTDATLHGPEGWWRARSVPVVYVRVRWVSNNSQLAWLSWWSTPRSSFPPNRALIVPIRDGLFHTYAVPLHDLAGYNGWITGLDLAPDSVDPTGTEVVDVACISWRPCVADRKAEAALIASGPVPYLDSFDGKVIDRSFWLPSGTGPSIDQTNGELQIDVPANSEPDSGGHAIVAGVMSRCVLHGDFDAQVDYRLLDWPEANGVHLDFGTNHPQAVGRQNMAGELIFAWFPPDVVNLPFGELGGSLRLVKRGETISGYVRAPGGWRRLLTADDAYDDAQLQLSITALDGEWAHEHVEVAFDNFRINAGRLTCR